MLGIFIISPNGLGHFKRARGWFSTLLDAFPDLELDVAAAAWQVERMGADWVHHPRLRFHYHITDEALRWSRSREHYQNADLLAWLGTLQNWPPIHAAHFVISDNMVEVLAIRPDTILMGSFLWGSVLQSAYPDLPGIQAYANKERELLQAHHPPLLCIGDMVMPYAEQHTRPQPMPWFTQRIQLPTSRPMRKQIAFLGGATPSIQEELMAVARTLSTVLDWDIRVPDRFHQEGDDLLPFDFSTQAWLHLDIAVCRPGIGTITDAVSYGVPLIALQEPENQEMVHNGKRIEELGLGRTIALEELGTIHESIAEMLQPDTHQDYRLNLLSRPVGGYAAATQWLQDYIIAKSKV